MERRKINSLDEIYDGNKLLIKEFINLDLTGMDLSDIPIEEWEGCIFFNTSFKNTGIKFIPNKLGYISEELFKKLNMKRVYTGETILINYCDFSDNDLSFLKRDDFIINNQGYEVGKYGCNFRNTGVNCFVNVENVLLDELYGEFDYDYWGPNIGYNTYPKFVDVNTIINNSFLNIPSARFLNAISQFLYEKNYKHCCVDGCKIDDNYKKYMVSLCEEFLEYDKEGYLKKLYYEISKDFSVSDKFDFFLLELVEKNFKDINLSDIPIDIIKMFTFQKNTLENVVIGNRLGDLLTIPSERFLDVIKGYENKYISCYFPGITYSSWQENESAKKRISDSAFTFYTKVYLELSRICNAKCKFCRNESFQGSHYDLEKIKHTLFEIKDYINALVIGGGEPTLRLHDVRDLREEFLDAGFDWHMFSNGSNPSFINDDYIMDNFRLNISRHAVDDYQNASIFGINVDKMMSYKDLEKLNIRNGEVTLNAVCFKGGLDSVEKIIEYINFARDIGCRKVLVQDLQRETSLGSEGIVDNGLCIDESIFPMVREYLKMNGYKEKNPIYATGGYVSYVFNDKDNFSVSIQNYISQQKLDEEWSKAMKRTFDLSIDPSGKLYENWNQNTGFVKQIKRY